MSWTLEWWRQGLGLSILGILCSAVLGELHGFLGDKLAGCHCKRSLRGNRSVGPSCHVKVSILAQILQSPVECNGCVVYVFLMLVV